VHLDAAVDHFVLYLTVERGFSAHTVRAYRADLARLSAFAEGRGIQAADGLTLDLLRDWPGRAPRPASPARPSPAIPRQRAASRPGSLAPAGARGIPACGCAPRSRAAPFRA
jgi:hypothetical protein